jgi:hypothetical protein
MIAPNAHVSDDLTVLPEYANPRVTVTRDRCLPTADRFGVLCHKAQGEVEGDLHLIGRGDVTVRLDSDRRMLRCAVSGCLPCLV